MRSLCSGTHGRDGACAQRERYLRRESPDVRVRWIAPSRLERSAESCVVAPFVAAAFGWRRPTNSERKAITSVAARVPHAGGSRVRVRGIRVSIVGPWASAGLTIDVDGYPIPQSTFFTGCTAHGGTPVGGPQANGA
jgi:hypothetical protein